MEEHKYIKIIGEVFWRGSPVRLPGQFFKSCYFTLRCTDRQLQRDKTFKIQEDYFTIHTYKELEIQKMREGYIIECLVRRDGVLWRKNGEIQMKNDFRNKDGGSVYYGHYPIVFDSYHLTGEIKVLNDKTNLEDIKACNQQFEDDVPF